MARIYEDPEAKRDVEGAEIAALPKRSRAALLRVWGATALLIVVAVVFYFAARTAADSRVAFYIAIAAAVVALLCLLIISLSTRLVRLRTEPEIDAEEKLASQLDQLDDRFAVFNDVLLDGVAADHVIVGPPGVFVIRSWADAESEPDAEAISLAKSAASNLQKMLPEKLVEPNVHIEPVICIPAMLGETVRHHGKGVWIVPTDKTLPSILKRSSQEGAITQNVDVTGAFNADHLLSQALEREMVRIFQLPRRKTMVDYQPR